MRKKFCKVIAFIFIAGIQLTLSHLLAQSTTKTILVEGTEREYIIHLPTGYTGDEAISLVLMLHNGYGSANDFEIMTGFSDKSNVKGFIVVYPNGTGDPRMWNGGNCCGDAMINKINDVGFISLLIDSLLEKYNVNHNKVYVAGFSNGSILAYRLAEELSDKIMAIACMSGPMMLDKCEPEFPVSVIHFHAMDDAAVPFNGGEASGYTFPSVQSVLDKWIDIDKCSANPEIIYDKDNILGKKWSGEDADIVLYTIPTGGHSWIKTPISVTDSVWSFFSKVKTPEAKLQTNNFKPAMYHTFKIIFPETIERDNIAHITLLRDEQVNIKMYNIKGNIVMSKDFSERGDYSVDLSNNNELSDGLYIITIFSGKEHMTKKIIL